MRLPSDQQVALKAYFQEKVKQSFDLYLFGSRVDDQSRGGDVDLLLHVSQPLERKVALACRLAAGAERLLGGRRVDVVILDPETKRQPIHEVALDQGIRL